MLASPGSKHPVDEIALDAALSTGLGLMVGIRYLAHQTGGGNPFCPGKSGARFLAFGIFTHRRNNFLRSAGSSKSSKLVRECITE